MKTRRILPIFAFVSPALTVSIDAADRIKQNNTNALNLARAWDSILGSGDVAVWNSTVTSRSIAGGNTITALGGDLSWQGIKIANVAGTANPSVTMAGIDRSNAAQALLIQSKITLAGNQSWNVSLLNLRRRLVLQVPSSEKLRPPESGRFPILHGSKRLSSTSSEMLTTAEALSLMA